MYLERVYSAFIESKLYFRSLLDANYFLFVDSRKCCPYSKCLIGRLRPTRLQFTISSRHDTQRWSMRVTTFTPQSPWQLSTSFYPHDVQTDSPLPFSISISLFPFFFVYPSTTTLYTNILSLHISIVRFYSLFRHIGSIPFYLQFDPLLIFTSYQKLNPSRCLYYSNIFFL